MSATSGGVGASTPDSPRRTRGGWIPAGTSASRRARTETASLDRARQTRGELVDAARRVFERKGYFAARVADIVAEAGLAHGSFYTYFASKQDVFDVITRELRDQIDEAVAPAGGGGDPYDALDRSNRKYLDVYRRNSIIYGLMEQTAIHEVDQHEVRLAARRKAVARVARTIRRWQKRGVADPDVDPETTAGALVSMVSNFAYWWLAGGDDRYDEERAARTLTQIWARAVGLKRPDEPPA